MINILYGYGVDKLKLKMKMKKIGSNCMIYGAILMPSILLGAVFYENLKYFTMIPATLIIISLVIMIVGRME